MLAAGGVVWLLFGLAPFIARGTPLCGSGSGWSGQLTATGVTAALIGVTLVAFFVWLMRRMPHAEVALGWTFLGVYAVALIVFCLFLAPAIWGPPGCNP